MPFEVPKSWEWVEIDNLFIVNPKNNIEDDVICGFVPMASVNDGYSGTHYYEERRWGEVKKGFCHFQNGDLGVAKISPCFENRKSVILNNLPNSIGAGTTELVILRPIAVYTKFYLYLVKTDWYVAEGTKNFKGVVGQQRVNKEIFSTLLIPLPPFAEQIRIVAEIEKWFTLIDTVEQGQVDLATLTEQAKSKILDLAIHGKLVPQDPADEPAIDLLRRINPQWQPCDTSHYENLPQGWSVTELGKLCKLDNGDKETGRRIYFDAKCLRGRTQGVEMDSGNLVRKGDYVILVDGENSGEVFVIPEDGYMGSTFKRLIMPDTRYCPYILYFIMFYKNMLRNSKKGAAIPHLNKELFKSLIIGIPPFAEQQRIVNRITELFSSLNSISQSLVD